MNDYFRKTLTNSRVYLVDNIDYDSLRDFLIESETLPVNLIENIDSNPNRRRRVREMLDCLPRRPDFAFSTFLASLHKSKQQHIADKLYEEACSLIGFGDYQLKETLKNTIETILSSSSITNSENNCVVPQANSVLQLRQRQEPIENSYVPAIQEEQSSFHHECDDEAMDEQASNRSEFSSLKSANYSKNCSFPSTFQNESKETFSRSSFYSQQKQESENNTVYQMDSNPRGLLCILTTAKRSGLKSDSLPVTRHNDKEPEASSHTTENTSVTLERDAELQSLFWKFGFYSCVIELTDATFHPDKLSTTILQFAQLPLHSKLDCCAIALLGFSVKDLHLSKTLSWFNNKNCPLLAGKPKLFLIQVPDNDDATLSRLMSGVEMPKDSLVAIGLEETNTQPGLVTSLFHVCQHMDQPCYSMQEVFERVQQFNINIAKRTVEITESFTKSWIVNPHCNLEKQDISLSTT